MDRAVHPSNPGHRGSDNPDQHSGAKCAYSVPERAEWCPDIDELSGLHFAAKFSFDCCKLV
jgi:hypothetical protein